MRLFLLTITVATIVTSISANECYAQQRQLPPVTMTYQPNTIGRSERPIEDRPVGPASPVTLTFPSKETSRTSSSNDVTKSTLPNRSGVANGQSAFQSKNDSNSSRLTNQQLQNPSGGFQLSHDGMSNAHNQSPNLSFGPEFNNWNNLRMPSSPSLDPFESFMRTPPFDSGGYLSPNNYLGSMYNDWSNLSSGSVFPNEMGGWTYQP